MGLALTDTPCSLFLLLLIDIHIVSFCYKNEQKQLHTLTHVELVRWKMVKNTMFVKAEKM